ncbi:MAG: rhamnulokinase, partial [Victivallaceae bacterium]
MRNVFLAFDLGASSGRAILGTLENNTLSLNEVHRFPNGPIEHDGSLFWDYPGLCNEIKTGLRKALAVEPAITSIALDTWGVDYALFDRTSRQLKRLPYHYRDHRTDHISEEVWEKIPQNELYA